MVDNIENEESCFFHEHDRVMPMRIIFLTVMGLMAVLLSRPAFSEIDSLSRLLAAKTIRCSIGSGYTSAFDGKKVSFEKGDFAEKAEDQIVTFAKIDLRKGSAIILGNAGTDDIAVKGAEVGLNFISFTGSGAMVVSTVFANIDLDGNYFFATSRHTQISFGKTTSLPSQWTGLCKIIE